MTGLTKVVDLPLDKAEAKVREVLSDHGFGVLTEIDVAATLKAKLGVSRRPLKILGACNPQLANAALELDPSVSLLLPCNVVLESEEGGFQTTVSIADPRELMPHEDFKELSEEAASSLSAALDELSS